MPTLTQEQLDAQNTAKGISQFNTGPAKVGTSVSNEPIISPAPAPATVPAPPTTDSAAPSAPPTAPVTVNMNNPSPTPEKTPYTVKSGDTLGGIAKAQGTTLADILASNPQYQQNPNLIKPGEQVNLAKKYQDFHESVKNTTSPDKNPRQQIQDQTQADTPTVDVQKQFQDTVSNFNPVEKMLYDQLTSATSTANTQKTFVDTYKEMENDPALVGLKTDLMNVNNIMKGTEDDIRDEITKAGGTGTESQIQAMTAARNKTLLKQANTLSSAIQQKEDYINQIMNLTQADRKEASDQVDKKLGLTKQLSNMIDKQTTAAKDNYQKIVDKVGYEGFSNSMTNDTQKATAEKVLGLAPGALSNPKFLEATKPPTTMASSIQEYEYAKKNGYKGSFSDYQNEDANRKAKATGSGIGGMFTAAQISSTINQIAGAFDNEAVVKQFNVINEGYQFAKNLSNTTTNPSDDQGLIYAFAKIMDPNSVVREGEYNTVKKYSQAWTASFGKSIEQAINGTGFLSTEARTNIKKTLEERHKASKQNYDNVYSEYQKRIKTAEAGGGNSITNYARAYTPTQGQTITYKGKKYQTDASGNFDPNKPI